MHIVSLIFLVVFTYQSLFIIWAFFCSRTLLNDNHIQREVLFQIVTFWLLPTLGYKMQTILISISSANTASGIVNLPPPLTKSISLVPLQTGFGLVYGCTLLTQSIIIG